MLMLFLGPESPALFESTSEAAGACARAASAETGHGDHALHASSRTRAGSSKITTSPTSKIQDGRRRKKKDDNAG